MRHLGESKRKLIWISIFFFCAINVQASEIIRSQSAIAAFKRMNPCPTNGRRSGACGGYVIDHKCPLDCGGKDAPENMQYQDKLTAHKKDLWEREGPTCHRRQQADSHLQESLALCEK